MYFVVVVYLHDFENLVVDLPRFSISIKVVFDSKLDTVGMSFSKSRALVMNVQGRKCITVTKY